MRFEGNHLIVENEKDKQVFISFILGDPIGSMEQAYYNLECAEKIRKWLDCI